MASRTLKRNDKEAEPFEKLRLETEAQTKKIRDARKHKQPQPAAKTEVTE